MYSSLRQLMQENIIRCNRIRKVLDHYTEMIERELNVLLVLDIDGVVLSSSFYKIFEESDICSLVTLVYETNPDYLLFLTNRHKSIKNYTNEQFNSYKLINTDKKIRYNIHCCDLDSEGYTLKGPEFESIIQVKAAKNPSYLDNLYVIFVDDQIENVQSMKISLERLGARYKIFHYKYTLL